MRDLVEEEEDEAADLVKERGTLEKLYGFVTLSVNSSERVRELYAEEYGVRQKLEFVREEKRTLVRSLAATFSFCVFLTLGCVAYYHFSYSSFYADLATFSIGITFVASSVLTLGLMRRISDYERRAKRYEKRLHRLQIEYEDECHDSNLP